MKHDIFVEFWDPQKRRANFPKIERNVMDTYQKIKLASLHLTTKRNRDRARKNKYKLWIREYLKKIQVENNALKTLIEDDARSLGNLEIPHLFIKIVFNLRKPYLSKDDEDFYIIDNPIAKDKVFKVPYIRSTTWKGALRRVTRDIAPQEIVERLFGNEKESEESRQGRLFFYSTSLNGIGLDVITPLDRINKKPARGPILFEVAPEGSEGEFKLLYLPFDLAEKLLSGKEDRQDALDEIKKDLDILKEAIPKMMLEYGFSAKKTSGYGVIEDEIEFWINNNHYKGTFKEFRDKMNELISKIGD